MKFTHLTQPELLKGPAPVTNAEGFSAFGETWKQTIARIALTGVLSPQFYRQEEAQAKEFLPAIQDAAKTDPYFLLNAARVSRKANFKLFPKLVSAALIQHAGPDTLVPGVRKIHERDLVKLLATYSPGQLLEVTLLLKAKTFGFGLGARAQRILGATMVAWGNKRLEDFTLTETATMNRLLRLVHPRFTGFANDIISYCLNGEGRDTKGDVERWTPRQRAMAMLPTLTDEAVPEWIRGHKLPFNAVKGALPNANTGAWRAVRDNMSPLQLLLNMKSLHEKGALTPAEFTQRLALVDLQFTRLVPHDILRPLGMTSELGPDGMSFADALLALLARVASRPLPGLGDKRVGVLLDFSGSMAAGYGGNKLGNWTLAVTLALPLITIPNRTLALFGTDVWLESATIPEDGFHKRGLRVPNLGGLTAEQRLRALLSMEPNSGTNIAKAVAHFLDNKIELDVLYLFTDEQENGTNTARSVWRAYRNNINPKAQLVIVNVSSLPWHIVQNFEPGVTTIQTVTPLVYDQLENYNQSPIDLIMNWKEA